MPPEGNTNKDSEIRELRARIEELESELHGRRRYRSRSSESSRSDRYQKDEDDRGRLREEQRRVLGASSDIKWRKQDNALRMFRGMALGSIEAVRLTADSIFGFAEGALFRNRPDDDRTTRDLVTRIPGDVITSAVDAAERMVDIPARAAERFSEAYQEGRPIERRAAYKSRREEPETEERVTYKVAPRNGKWAVEKEGAQRAISNHDTKDEALEQGRRLARDNAPSELVVLKQDGSVQDTMTYD